MKQIILSLLTLLLFNFLFAYLPVDICSSYFQYHYSCNILEFHFSPRNIFLFFFPELGWIAYFYENCHWNVLYDYGIRTCQKRLVDLKTFTCTCVLYFSKLTKKNWLRWYVLYYIHDSIYIVKYYVKGYYWYLAYCFIFYFLLLFFLIFIYTSYPYFDFGHPF